MSKPIILTRQEQADVVHTIAFIATHYKEKISPESIAFDLNMTPKRLQQVFKHVTGRTIHQQFLTERLQNVKNDLLETDLPVKALSKRHGFATTSHFVHQFKLKYNITPERMRRIDQQTPIDQCRITI